MFELSARIRGLISKTSLNRWIGEIAAKELLAQADPHSLSDTTRASFIAMEAYATQLQHKSVERFLSDWPEA